MTLTYRLGDGAEHTDIAAALRARNGSTLTVTRDAYPLLVVEDTRWLVGAACRAAARRLREHWRGDDRPWVAVRLAQEWWRGEDVASADLRAAAYDAYADVDVVAANMSDYPLMYVDADVDAYAAAYAAYAAAYAAATRTTAELCATAYAADLRASLLATLRMSIPDPHARAEWRDLYRDERRLAGRGVDITGPVLDAWRRTDAWVEVRTKQ